MTEPPAALDPTSIIAAAKTFRDAVRAFGHLVRKRPREDRYKSRPPQDGLPVGAAAAALGRALAPSNPDRRWDDDGDILGSDNLTPAARLLLRKVWVKLAEVEWDAQQPDGVSLVLNLDTDEWDVLLADVLAALGPIAPVAAIDTNADTQTVIYDGRSFVISDLPAFKLFAALVKAHTEGRTPITRHELFGSIGRRDCDPRFKEFFDKYPSTLRKLIRSSRKPGGGYWLCLPSLKKK
jgi:hypothetical protein